MHTFICYTFLCEAKKTGFLSSTASLEQTPGLLAGTQRLSGPGAQALHSPQLPHLRQRQKAPQLPPGLYRGGPSALPVCAERHGASNQTGFEQWQAD